MAIWDDDEWLELSREEMEDFAISKMDSVYEDIYKWEIDGHESFVRDVGNLSEETLRDIVERDGEEFGDLAHYGYDEGMEEPPDWLVDMGWYDDDGEWHNPFWYH